MLQQDPTKAEISCRLSAATVLYFERQYGRARLEEVYAGIEGAPPLSYVRDLNNWMSFELTIQLIDAFAEASGDPEFAHKAGAFTISPDALGFVYYMVRALATPKPAFQRLVSLSPSANRMGEFAIDRISDRDMVLRYQSKVKEPSLNICRMRMGQLGQVPTVWGLPAAKIIHAQCQTLGAQDCVYEFSWIPYSSALPSVLGGALTGIAASFLLFWKTFGPWNASAIGLAIGGSIGLALALRAKSAEASKLLADQDESLAQSVADLGRRFDEIQQLNQTLEQKVEARTQELSLASARLKAALEKQVELDRLKTNFFQNISHELRTPLTLILAPLDSLTSEDNNLSRESRSQLEIMRRSAVRLLSMINSLLDLSRLEAGKTRLNLEELDPAATCRQLVESAQDLAHKRNITLRYVGQERLPPVPLDVDKLEKVVLNLISNALKFTSPDGGREALVEVSAEIVDARLRISVRDTGIGIPRDELQNIFQRFHQVDGSDERKYGGTGIGLSLVKELVEFHLGEVKVDSKQGQGSTFTISLPTTRGAYPEERLDRRRINEEVAFDRRKEEHQRRLAQVIVNPADLALADLQPAVDGSGATVTPISVVTGPPRERLLLADDNEDMLTYLSTILRRDYDVVTATDGEQAFELAVQRLPHVIVSDVMMPKKNGYALVRDLKRHPSTRSIPVILVTAKADSHEKVAGIESGADDYLTKPFNFLELRARIRQLLKTRALERELAQRNEHLSKLNFDLILSKKEVFLQTIEALAFALEAKDPYTAGHSRRVSLLSTELSRHLSLTELDIERVQIAAVLHDIGKLGIDDHILRKTDKLTPAERAVIEAHPEIGYRILESVKELTSVNECILMHHERFDGTGYPKRASGHNIPLGSRIIAVTDTYDAMTSTRPYRKGLSHERAIQELRDCAGAQFDPEIVRGFLQMYEKQAPQFPNFPSVFNRAEG